MEELREIKEKLAAIESLLQRLPELEANQNNGAQKQKAMIAWKKANQQFLHDQGEVYFALIELLRVHGIVD